MTERSGGSKVAIIVEVESGGADALRSISIRLRRDLASDETVLIANQDEYVDDADLREAVAVMLRSAVKLVEGNDEDWSLTDQRRGVAAADAFASLDVLAPHPTPCARWRRQGRARRPHTGIACGTRGYLLPDSCSSHPQPRRHRTACEGLDLGRDGQRRRAQEHAARIAGELDRVGLP